MPFKEQSGYCAACNKQVLVRRETTNHVLYAVLTIFSCGLWGIVWIIQSIAESGKPWLCTMCGLPTFASYDQYQRLQHSQDSSSMFSPSNTSPTKPVSILLGIGIFFMPYIFSWFTLKKGYSSLTRIISLSWMGLVLLINIPIIILDSRNKEPRNTTTLTSTTNTSTTASSTPSEAPKQEAFRLDKNSSDYKAGYSKGHREGRSWAKEVVGSTGMPQPVAIRAMAKYQAEEAKTKDAATWQSGWEDGFVDGYRNIKPSKIKEADFEPLAWSNAKPNVKLYDNEGNYQVTIIAVNQVDGKITVKYPKERGGVVEDKMLDSLSSLWFVRKSGSR